MPWKQSEYHKAPASRADSIVRATDKENRPMKNDTLEEQERVSGDFYS